MFLAAECCGAEFFYTATVPSICAHASLSSCSFTVCVSQYVGAFVTRHRQPPLLSMVLLLSSFLFACWSRYFCFGRFLPLRCDGVSCCQTVTKLCRMQRPLFIFSAFFRKRTIPIAWHNDAYAFSARKSGAKSIITPMVDTIVFASPNRQFRSCRPLVPLHEPFDLANHISDFPELY